MDRGAEMLKPKKPVMNYGRDYSAYSIPPTILKSQEELEQDRISSIKVHSCQSFDSYVSSCIQKCLVQERRKEDVKRFQKEVLTEMLDYLENLTITQKKLLSSNTLEGIEIVLKRNNRHPLV